MLDGIDFTGTELSQKNNQIQDSDEFSGTTAPWEKYQEQDFKNTVNPFDQFDDPAPTKKEGAEPGDG